MNNGQLLFSAGFNKSAKLIGMAIYFLPVGIIIVLLAGCLN